MGYMKHHAIVVTGSDVAQISQAREYAITIGMAVSEVVTSPVNAYWSFFVAPDGSKEGWESSNTGDLERQNFIDFLNQAEPGGVYAMRKLYLLNWVEVIYGDENGPPKIVRSDDKAEEID
jgi:hypothetical protein